MSGPTGKWQYLGCGDFKYENKMIDVMKQKVGLIAGGTGITPCLSIIQAAHFAQDYLDIRLLLSYKTKKDIISYDLLKKL